MGSPDGYGSGFVSKAQRLAGQIRYTGPGPGAYEQLEPEAKLWHLANRAVTIPKAKADELHDAKTASLPGPGAFEPTETRLGQRMAWTACPASQRSAFRASARAFSFAGGKGVPPVGAYNLAKRWQTKEVNHTNFKLAPGHVRPTARTTRPKSPQQLMSALASPAGSVLSPKPDPRDVLPGPGAYETQEVETIDKKLAGIAGKVSSMFGKAVVEADRFGRPIQPRADRGNMPGPGQHASEYGNFATSQRGTRAGFLDRSGRSMQHSMSALEHRPPGPAFYHAELPVKKHSFLTGEAHTFVPA
ncbi:hypothetical protein WJX72_002330 [[Myrmecia] bisecta]|uniref:Flagellar associated protein n=1 Tax=[Myrmecia] bisecta TaxID=41462 RepID=A0AAW1PK24_9CHLO